MHPASALNLRIQVEVKRTHPNILLLMKRWANLHQEDDAISDDEAHIRSNHRLKRGTCYSGASFYRLWVNGTYLKARARIFRHSGAGRNPGNCPPMRTLDPGRSLSWRRPGSG